MTPLEKANLVALPILGGSILRLVLGFMSDYIGPKLTAQIGMSITLIPLLLGWLWVDSLSQLYVVALLLGVAGASLPPHFHSRDNGIPRSTRDLLWELPEQGIAGRYSLPCLPTDWLLISAAGKSFSDSPSFQSWSFSSFSPSLPVTVLTGQHRKALRVRHLAETKGCLGILCILLCYLWRFRRIV